MQVSNSSVCIQEYPYQASQKQDLHTATNYPHIVSKILLPKTKLHSMDFRDQINQPGKTYASKSLTPIIYYIIKGVHLLCRLIVLIRNIAGRFFPRNRPTMAEAQAAADDRLRQETEVLKILNAEYKVMFTSFLQLLKEDKELCAFFKTGYEKTKKTLLPSRDLGLDNRVNVKHIDEWYVEKRKNTYWQWKITCLIDFFCKNPDFYDAYKKTLKEKISHPDLDWSEIDQSVDQYRRYPS